MNLVKTAAITLTTAAAVFIPTQAASAADWDWEGPFTAGASCMKSAREFVDEGGRIRTGCRFYAKTPKDPAGWYYSFYITT